METIKEKAEAYAREQCGDYYNEPLNNLEESIGSFCVKDFIAGYKAGLNFAEETIDKFIESQKSTFTIIRGEGNKIENLEFLPPNKKL